MHRYSHKQKGVASLLVSVMLLIGVTLVTLLTARVVLVQTQTEANNYRASQAFAAANSALDYAVSYYNNGGPDQNGDCVLDVLPALTYTSSDGSQVTSATVSFNDNDGVCASSVGKSCVDTSGTTVAGVNTSEILISATGLSDDGVASRTITQCMGVVQLTPAGGGPQQPLVSGGGVGLTGNFSVVNRYSGVTIWSGEPVNIGNSSAAKTYLRPDGTSVSDYTTAQLNDIDPGDYSQIVSTSDQGNSFDIIDNDPGLASLTGDQVWNSFFAPSRAEMQSLARASGQEYSNISDAIGKSGVIWMTGDGTVDAEYSLNANGTIGSASDPAVLIIDSNIRITGGPTIYGLVYVRGKLTAAGGFDVVGSMVVEGDNSIFSGASPVVGNGTPNLIYAPFPDGEDNVAPSAPRTPISGSWKDW
jgi:Tfp pilus assembly protein PilX